MKILITIIFLTMFTTRVYSESIYDDMLWLFGDSSSKETVLLRRVNNNLVLGVIVKRNQGFFSKRTEYSPVIRFDVETKINLYPLANDRVGESLRISGKNTELGYVIEAESVMLNGQPSFLVFAKIQHPKRRFSKSEVTEVYLNFKVLHDMPESFVGLETQVAFDKINDYYAKKGCSLFFM